MFVDISDNRKWREYQEIETQLSGTEVSVMSLYVLPRVSSASSFQPEFLGFLTEVTGGSCLIILLSTTILKSVTYIYNVWLFLLIPATMKCYLNNLRNKISPDICGSLRQRSGTINISLTLFDFDTDKTCSLGNMKSHCVFFHKLFLLHSQWLPLF